MLLPEELYNIVEQKLQQNGANAVKYQRVFMSLLDVLSGEFFNHYIKRGDIIMRSEGRSRTDRLMYIHSGILHLELDRATHERCGLVGEPIPDGGRKHVKHRFLIKADLRSPSMLHGKKGFERLVWAAREVLVGDVEWLFADLRPSTGDTESPIAKLHPFQYDAQPQVRRMHDLELPGMPREGEAVSMNYAEELLEWIGLACIASPRIASTDNVDAFLCRYRGPSDPYADALHQQMDVDERKGTASVVCLRWHGFLPPAAVKLIMLAAESACTSEQSWIAMTVSGFESQSYTVCSVGRRVWLSWQCE